MSDDFLLTKEVIVVFFQADKELLRHDQEVEN
jgi:hypothetical protein